MKNTLIIAIPALMIGYGSLAQGSPAMELPTVYVQNTVTGSNQMPSDVLGSPYLNEKFVLGTVIIKGEESYNSYLRYNAYNDEIEMQNENTASAVMKRDYISVRIGTDIFSVHSYAYEGGIKNGYFNALNEGKATLLRRRQVILKQGQEATSSYAKDKPPKFEMEESYYISLNGETAQPVKLNKKGVLSVLSENGDVLGNYVKKNKLKLKSEKEVLQVLDHYNTM